MCGRVRSACTGSTKEPRMVRYRLNRVPDGTCCFTVTLRDRRSDARVRHVEALRSALRAARCRVPHGIVAAVVFPDHLHAVVTMCDGPGDYSQLLERQRVV